MEFIGIFVAVLAALLIHDLVRFGAGKLVWRWLVNRGESAHHAPKVQIAKALAGIEPKYGR